MFKHRTLKTCGTDFATIIMVPERWRNNVYLKIRLAPLALLPRMLKAMGCIAGGAARCMKIQAPLCDIKVYDKMFSKVRVNLTLR